jgi:hypothetical protein
MTDAELIVLLREALLCCKPDREIEWDRSQQGFVCPFCLAFSRTGVNMPHLKECPYQLREEALRASER